MSGGSRTVPYGLLRNLNKEHGGMFEMTSGVHVDNIFYFNNNCVEVLKGEGRYV